MIDHQKHHRQLKRIFQNHHIKMGRNIRKIQDHLHGRKPSSGLNINLYETVAQIPSDEWNSVNQDNVLLSPEYLKAVEDTSPKGMKSYYAIHYENSKPVMISYYQMLKVNRALHEKISPEPEVSTRNFIVRIHDSFAEKLNFNMLICGNALLSGENGFSYLPGLDRETVYLGISESLRRIKDRLKGESTIDIILIKDFSVKNEGPGDIFPRFHFQKFSSGPNMVVPIRKEWHSFEDYTKSMKSKYRRRVKSSLKKGRDLIKKSLTYEELSDSTIRKEIYELYLEVVNRAKFKLFALDIDFFAGLKKQLQDNFMFDLYYAEKRIVGFTTRIFNGDVMEGYTHGIKYDLNRRYELYQNILYDDIKVAIENKCTQINLGRTSIAMKSSVGAIADELTFFISLKNPVSNHILKAIKFFLKPSSEICRNPFA
ncbi:MAG: N-acetyltransferase [Spirochaetaceae bacterium]|nr:N-acetyltransferase [Spirochaetaceae bacterium]